MQEQFEHFFQVIEMEWPKALLTSIIPVSQYAWKLWRDRQIEARKAILRERIRELSQFIQVSLPDAPDAANVRRDAEIEYAEAVAKLAELCGHDKKTPATFSHHASKEDSAALAKREGIPPAVERAPATPAAEPAGIGVSLKQTDAPSPSARNWLRRWFLLYVPKRRSAWIPQTLFFAVLSFTFFGAIGILSDPADPDFSSAILGLLVFVGIALLLRIWAVRANAQAADHAASSKKPRRWVPIVVTIVGIFYEIGFFIVLATDDDDNFSAVALRQNGMAIVLITLVISAVVFAFWRRLRRRTLLYEKLQQL